MGITDRTFGKQKSTGDRVKQAIIWFCVIPQAVAGWLVMFRYADLYFSGVPVRLMTYMDRFWLQTGIWVMLVILAIQIIYVWTLRAAYHRVEHVKETIIQRAGEGEGPHFEMDHWVTELNENGLESEKVGRLVNAQQLMFDIYTHPPESVSRCKALMKEMRKQKLDLNSEPWKKIYNDLLNTRKKLERKENREKKERLTGPSPTPMFDPG